MSTYGLVHLPSLLAFIHPQPSTTRGAARDSVDILATGQGDFDDVASSLANMAEAERRETAFRVTALSHEIRHFHDFLLTPSGNQLVRDAFWYAILTFGALTELAQQQQGDRRLKVPLPVDPARLPIYGQRLVSTRSAFHEHVAQSRSLMEANAMHVQIQQAEIDLGPPAAEAVASALPHMKGSYSEVLTDLRRLQERHQIADVEFGRVVLPLTLMSLLDLLPGKPADVIQAISRGARDHTGHRAAQSIVSAAVSAIERVVRRAMAASQEENEKFLEMLGRALPDPLRSLVRDAFADFAGAARDLQRRFLADPMLMLDPGRYLRQGIDELVNPLLYLLPDGATTMQVRDRSWAAKLSDPLTHVREYVVDGQTVYQLVCVPAPHQSNTLNEDVWKSFAEVVAGSLVIAEGADREHPVQGMWMRKMEQRWPIDFTAFGGRAAWQVAPVGEVV